MESYTFDLPEGTVMSMRPAVPGPEDFAISVTLNWLNRDGGIAVATASIRAEGFPGARNYYLQALIGPDGHHAIDAQMVDGLVVADGAFLPQRQHSFTSGQCIEAIRAQWAAERGA